MKLTVFACLMIAVSSAWAGQPAFITTPPAISTGARAGAQRSVGSSADLNQAAMSQIINQLNQRQFQLSVAAAQTRAQQTVFVPQKITVKRGK